MIKNVVMALLIVVCALSASADDYDNFNSDGQSYEDFNSTKGDKYRNWQNVLDMLAAKGIDTSSIDWSVIDAGCKESKNNAPDKYNQCKYDNAINYSEYTKDIDYCNAAADQKYFDYIKSADTSLASNNSVVTLQKDKKSLNKRQQQEFKYSYNVLCMRDLGWDGGSWIGGKSEIAKPIDNNKRGENNWRRNYGW